MTVVSSGQTYRVSANQTDTGDVVLSGGKMIVESGGEAIATTVENGGSLKVHSGGTISGTINRGFDERIMSGGVAIGTIVSGRGREYDYGVASGTILDNGDQVVANGGFSVSTIVGSGCQEFVDADAAAIGTVVSNGGAAFLWGSGSGLVIHGGTLSVEQGGFATATLINSGLEAVGGTTNGTIVSGGEERCNGGGVTNDCIVVAGGIETVNQNGAAINTVVSSGGNLTVYRGGSVLDPLVANGGTMEFTGALADTGTIALDSTGDATELVISGTGVFKGNDAVTLNDSASNAIVSNGAAAQLVNDSTIEGSGTIGDANLAVINKGTIDATGSLAPLKIAAASLINHGLIEATGTAGLIITGDVINTGGTLAAAGGDLTVTGMLKGSSAGEATIANGSTLTIGGKVSASQSVIFEDGSTGTLVLNLAQKFAGTVAGLAQGGAIDLKHLAFSQAMITGVSGTGDVGTDTVVTVQAGSRTANIALLNQYANQFAVDASAYQLVSDNRVTPGTLFELAPPH
jgi:autotransporter passenger strand-loop-strand repeat protein